MFNYKNLTREQIKGLSGYLFDISKASIIGAIALSAASGNLTIKLIGGVINFAFGIITLDIAMNLLKKLK